MSRSQEGSGGKLGCAAIVVGLLFAVYGFSWMAFRGDLVKVPTAHIGRIKTTSGFQAGFVEPRTLRLPPNWFGRTPSKLILAETSEHQVHEPIEALYVPADQLNLAFDLVGTFMVSHEHENAEHIYDRLSPQPWPGNASMQVITFDQVYKTYAQQVFRTTGQEIVAAASIEHTMETLDAVSKAIFNKVNERLANTPLKCTSCGIGAIQPPAIIVTAQEKARKRQIEIETANNNKLVSLTIADAQYQVGLKRQEIELLEAETQVLTDLVVSDAVSEAYIAQRALNVLNGLASNPNATFLLSTKYFQDPTSLLGLSRETAANLHAASPERDARLRHAMDLIEKAKAEAATQAAAEAGTTPTDAGTAPADQPTTVPTPPRGTP